MDFKRTALWTAALMAGWALNVSAESRVLVKVVGLPGAGHTPTVHYSEIEAAFPAIDRVEMLPSDKEGISLARAPLMIDNDDTRNYGFYARFEQRGKLGMDTLLDGHSTVRVQRFNDGDLAVTLTVREAR